MITGQRTHHTITVGATPDAVYRLLSDTTGWPRMFGPTVHVEQLARSADHERFRIWATTPEGPRSWTSRRRLDRTARRITFEQEEPPPVVGSMTGHWQVEPVGGGSRVVLSHDFTARDGSADGLRIIREAVDRNSERELAALRRFAERADRTEELTVVVEDVHVVDTGPAELYRFLYEAQHWPDRVPHVARLALTEPEPGTQVLDMDTQAPDGSRHRTCSVRVCLPPDRIVYKQVDMPAFMATHLGEWLLRPAGAGRTEAVARHTVVLDPGGVRQVLGPDASLAEARRLVAASLRNNSAVTLRCGAEPERRVAS